jgi:ferritin-like metal-binding protein YciE
MAAAKPKTLDDLFVDTLKDIFYAEKQILKALPKMAKAANSDQLRAGFEKHRDQTESQIERLEGVFDSIGVAARGKTCDAIIGILEEGKSIMEEFEDSPALDAGLVAAAQAVEHYEIARYGTLIAWAKQMGKTDVVKLLQANLAEEEQTDADLSKLAQTSINKQAQAAAA